MRKSLGAAVALLLWLSLPGVSFAGGPETHVVQPGDTLYSLAKRYGTTVAALVTANGLDSSNIIRIGQRLAVPAGEAAGLSSAQPPKATAAAAKAAVTPVTPVQSGPGAVVRTPEDETAAFFAANADRGVVVGRPPAPAVSRPPAVVPPAAPPASTPAVSAPATAVAPASAPARVISVTEEERLLLARLVLAEAGNEPAIGQLGVAAVVVNRVRHPAFPKSVEGVIDEPGQFKSVELGRVANLTPGEEVLKVVDRALAGEDPTGGALFFYNPVKSVALDFWKTRPVTAVIGGHNFAR